MIAKIVKKNDSANFLFSNDTFIKESETRTIVFLITYSYLCMQLTSKKNSLKPLLMKKAILSFFLSCCAGLTMAQQEQSISPANIPGPETEFAMQLRVTLGQPYSVGETPHGRRTVIPITGGTFEGPLLRGTILNGGADWQLAKGNRTELEAIYSICTDDSVYIHIRNRGIIFAGADEKGKPQFYFKAAPQFEAPEGSKYAWLNNALFLCAPAPSQGGGITLNVWKVK